MAQHCPGQAAVQKSLRHGAGDSGALAAVQDHQIDLLRKVLEGINDLGGSGKMNPPQLILQDQALLPGVAGEVQNLGKDGLLRRPRR